MYSALVGSGGGSTSVDEMPKRSRHRDSHMPSELATSLHLRETHEALQRAGASQYERMLGMTSPIREESDSGSTDGVMSRFVFPIYNRRGVSSPQILKEEQLEE
eukprot:CAMPEP_0194295254 /NCGR_PEP_ID=MMETSP0169-20130528/52993_1 /TAXON_ID=218684 /ORGANISM="Corethron pennatum, Strain L29A3" /LENGTH=103 /DNA_ID=CAMNT_0039044377 /DNA_START=295 /DNA_END=603 /DNA_ORIENTATION=-